MPPAEPGRRRARGLNWVNAAGWRFWYGGKYKDTLGSGLHQRIKNPSDNLATLSGGHQFTLGEKRKL
jgi:hypothetical protein